MTARPGRVIKGIFALQIALGAALVVGDIPLGMPRLPGGDRAPALEQPVRPGDQTRRYRPDALPDDGTNRPFPSPADLPDRLALETAEIDGRPVMRMLGTIAPGDGERVTGLLAERIAAAPATELFINSPGGSVDDALEIGRAIRRMDLATAIAAGDVCLSACPYLLAGGTTRSVDAAGSVGVHQHYFGENTVLPAFLAVKDVQRGQGRVMAYLDEMGIDPMVMQHALTTPPEEIYVLVPEELERYRLVTPVAE